MAEQKYEERMEIYVGIDVHLKSWTVSICTKSLVHKTFSQPPEVNTLMGYLRKNFPDCDYYSVYEAGFSGFWLDHELKKEGVNNIVVNAAFSLKKQPLKT